MANPKETTKKTNLNLIPENSVNFEALEAAAINRPPIVTGQGPAQHRNVRPLSNRRASCSTWLAI